MRSPESQQMPRRPAAPPRAPVTRIAAAVALTSALSACNTVVLKPAGDVAQQQGDMVVIATVLMLLIIVPVIAATLFFAWHYRASNKQAKYEPDWDHSTQLELLIWAAPLLIIICLGALTWVGTHLLDPYRTIGRIDAKTPITAADKPLEVEAIALDWKWLFIYPEQGIATVNELVVPENRPLHFRITASSVMNSFYIPELAGQIYAMPGMETRLNAVFNKTSAETGHDFDGFSANYSGAGFSGMHFAVRSVKADEFSGWVSGVKAGGAKSAGALDTKTYLALEKPSENVAAMQYASVEPKLYSRIVDMCVEPGKMCMSEMMAIDARGGLGKAGIRNVQMLTYDKHGREAAKEGTENPDQAVRKELAWVRALCKQDPGAVRDSTVHAPADKSSLTGFGLKAPQSLSRAEDDIQSTPAHPSKISRN
ncbi:ubiquinol oxidase subunit II [Novosphingobium sp. 1949]|uniref:Ubiquinol oxidase polypeptide II n=1 Tax=Novosphingobium organovorum TaxID=2930092 RepID=A0ABT0B9S0_9SPHN|nr:ubiquinol oxidase subunit II [Novosphingobium organovorum]MCJ2181768.1 ubiquinol oxidase subunit II [Novosphingobium organovorum]